MHPTACSRIRRDHSLADKNKNLHPTILQPELLVSSQKVTFNHQDRHTGHTQNINADLNILSGPKSSLFNQRQVADQLNKHQFFVSRLKLENLNDSLREAR